MTTAGWVNAHTHIYSALSPLGMPEPSSPPASFVQILERVWWRLDRAIDADSLRAAARLYAAEALLAGTTTLIDHHESPDFIDGSLDVIADACQEAGIRALVCYGATERNGGRDEARRGLAECARFLRENRRPLVRGAVGLHASFTVSDETLSDAAALARLTGTVTHVHLAEDGADLIDARSRGYAGPLERLLELGALPAGSILAHGVHLSRAEVVQCGELGLWLVQNPRSNQHNRVGFPSALGASDRVALGTDGFPADMAAERDALQRIGAACVPAFSPSIAHHRLDAGRVLAGERFGAGAIARDLVTWAPGGSGGPRRVETVEVDGRRVVEDGRLVKVDLEAVRAEAREQAPLLWRRMESVSWQS